MHQRHLRTLISQEHRIIKAKTSLTHPLQIASVAVPGGGNPGLTFCPGKKQPSAKSRVRDRDLDIDLAAVKNWGAGAVVTSMEAHEPRTRGVHAMADVVGVREMQRIHLPIVDMNVPDADFEQMWEASRATLRGLLAGD